MITSVYFDAGAGLEELNGEDNHVHLLVNFPAGRISFPAGELVEGVGSRRLGSEFPELENVCWNGKKLWAPGYYAGTTGGAGIDASGATSNSTTPSLDILPILKDGEDVNG